MVDAVDEVLNRIELQRVEPDLPEGIMALPLLQMAYRGKVQLTLQQMRAAIESLPYETPKLSATAIATMDGLTFAEALERCIERSKAPPPLLNGPVEPLPASEMKAPMARYRRF
ncbi:MAG: hypothetical protein WAK55_22285 [Xanthobacteraceae bacterium]